MLARKPIYSPIRAGHDKALRDDYWIQVASHIGSLSDRPGEGGSCKSVKIFAGTMAVRPCSAACDRCRRPHVRSRPHSTRRDRRRRPGCRRGLWRTSSYGSRIESNHGATPAPKEVIEVKRRTTTSRSGASRTRDTGPAEVESSRIPDCFDDPFARLKRQGSVGIE